MLHACDQRFDVTENLENFYELNEALVVVCSQLILVRVGNKLKWY